MTLARSLSTASMLAILAGPAFADLTAEEVLADQLAQMAIYGLDVTTNGESRSGNALIVEGLTAIAEIPEEDFVLNMTMGGATFTEQGDGSVIITYPDTIPLSVTVSVPDVDEDVTIDMSITQTGLQSVATGSADQLRYEITGQSVSLNDFAFSGPDEAGEVDMALDVNMSGFLAVMNIAAGDVRPYDIDMVVDSMTGSMRVQDPDEEGNMDLNFSLSALKAVYEGTMAKQGLMDSFAQVIQAGNVTRGTLAHGAANYDLMFDSPDGAFQGSASVGSGDFNFSMDEAGIDYGGTSKNLEVTFGGSAIPFPPMTIKMAENGGRFKLPVIPGEDPQDFALVMSLIGLELDPFLWSMIDPGGQLPQDPATLIIDTDGEVILTQDIFAPEFAEQAMMMGPPGQINALNLNQLQLSLAGAELTGDGELTFNNDSGIPMPVGVVNLMLTGGNTLLDTLVGMGLIPEEQAMGARMMTGMFARPGDGPDTLISTIEMNEDGSILANGQRIR